MYNKVYLIENDYQLDILIFLREVRDVPKKLSEAVNGEHVLIQNMAINGQCTNNSMRLMDMGLLPGTPLEVFRISHYGGLIIVKLRGFKLSFRIKEAENILVTTI